MSYNYSLTTFSPSGKLVQIEYALNAVNAGITAVGIKAANGSVLVTERRKPSNPTLVDARTIERISVICPGVGCVYAGMGGDARILIAKARKAAEAYHNGFGEYPGVGQVVKELASVMQEYTQSGGVRPFGVSLLVIGFDSGCGDLHGNGNSKETAGKSKNTSLYQVDPSGAYWAWKCTAIGSGMQTSKAFLEKRFTDNSLQLEDAVHMALLTLKEAGGVEGGVLCAESVEIGVVGDDSCFRILGDEEVADYIANLV